MAILIITTQHKSSQVNGYGKASLSEEEIACRSSGIAVKRWCEENGINVKSYYRWERLNIAEASARIQIPTEQGQEAGALVRIEPERLPVGKPFPQSREPDKPYDGQGIIQRHGGVKLELPEGMGIDRVAELVKALSSA